MRFQTPVPAIERRYIPDGWLGLNWHVVTTISKPRLETSTTWDQLAYAELFALGLPVIMPTYDVKVRVSEGGKRKRYCSYVEKLLMAGYLLVGLGCNDDALLSDLMRSKSTCRYVGGVLAHDSGMPLRVKSGYIKRLAYELNVGEHRESIKQVKPDNLPNIGERVVIGDGVFEGKCGIVDKFQDKYSGGKRRVSTASVLLEIFGSQRVVKIGVDSLQVIS